jgi:hypothetical protein
MALSFDAPPPVGAAAIAFSENIFSYESLFRYAKYIFLVVKKES